MPEEAEKSSYIRKGEFLFISPKYPQLALVLHGGEAAIVAGRVVERKPVYASFIPGPFGGEFRTTKADVAQAIREHSAVTVEHDVVEVTTDEQLAEIARLTKDEIRDGKPKVHRGSLSTKLQTTPKAETPSPLRSTAPAPAAAAGPKL